MGLCVGVGVLADLGEHDPEGAEWARADFAKINAALRAAGLPAHHEPDALPAEATRVGGDLFGYSGLHYLRRIAAHLWEGRPVPPPGDQNAAGDLVLQRYHQQQGEPRPGLLGRLTGARARGPRFDHLIMHSDAEGYYVPVDFPRVIFGAGDDDVPGGMLGSSPRLLAECEHLAAALGLPTDIDPEADAVFEAAESQGQGTGWRAYGIEAHSCLHLIHCARASLRWRTAISFG